MTNVVWLPEEIEVNLKKSDAWMARAMYVLGKNYDQLAHDNGLSNTKGDRTFFISFFTHFRDNGHFTTRQIKLGRLKMREEYINILTKLANVG